MKSFFQKIISPFSKTRGPNSASVVEERNVDREPPEAAQAGMSTPTKLLCGVSLEQFLIELSGMMAPPASQGWSPAALRRLQTQVIEIGRYHLAGFSKDQILEECCSTPEAREFSEGLYTHVVELVSQLMLNDPATGEVSTPSLGDACALLEVPRDRSIDHARMGALAKPMMAFVKGDYDTCAVFGGYGAAAFGRHLYYQLNIIGNFRRGRDEEARIAGCAAQNGLQISSWHGQLAELTLGKVKAADLLAQAKDNSMRFQVNCFEGLRLFTNGDKGSARHTLTVCEAIPCDLLEKALVRADLERC